MPVAEFVEAVASPDHAVPAGASVAALTAAASAALLVLVCGVLEHRGEADEATTRRTTHNLKRQLLDLVDEDARAYQAALESERGSPSRREANERAARIPIEIGRASTRIVELASGLEARVGGAVRLDVGAAKQMADAATRSAPDIGEYNLRLVADPSTRQALQDEITELRQSVV
jgi:formiminotetrahydrofolate cyclodeaminase